MLYQLILLTLTNNFMKLYGHIQSERASKGQGGNDYLIILIKDEEGENIAKINVYNDKENDQIITTFQPLNCTESHDGKAVPIKTRRYFTANNSGKQTKGKRQKGECDLCGWTPDPTGEYKGCIRCGNK